MSDFTDGFDDDFDDDLDLDLDLDDLGDRWSSRLDEDPPIYRSGRVRIIGAEPAGNVVRDVTGPVVDNPPDMPHWNDAPTGQVPAILDRGGDEPSIAPPIWREEETDWVAHEEVFEPSMLSGEMTPVGSLADQPVDVERQPWHFDGGDLPADDETLVMEEPLAPHLEPHFSPAPEYATERAPVSEPEVTPAPEPVRAAGPARAFGRVGAAGARLSPPEPPQPRVRTPRQTRVREDARNTNGSGGTSGRNMRVAVGSGILLGVAALVCFKLGNVASLVIVTLVVLLASAEACAAFRKAHYHPATLLGLVATLSLMVETYNKGEAALPLVLVMLVAASFVWFLARVEPAADPITGLASTVLIFTWIGGFGSFAALMLNNTSFPDRHGIAFLLAAVITTVAADVAALMVGSAIGHHPMAPSISPHKSWEGFLGGAVASVLVAVVVVHFIHPWTVGKALVLGLVVAVVAPLGDLSQSMIKRHLGLKDMGRIMPGHGGLLDRVDGLLFALPATYFVVKALHLG